MSAPRELRVEIDRLVLEGVPAAAAAAVVEAMEAELGRLLAGPGLPAGLPDVLEVERLDAGELPAAPGRAGHAGGLGAALARALHGSLAG